MPTFIAEIIGKVFGVWYVAWLINKVVIKIKKTEKDAFKVKAVVLSALLYILIPTFLTNVDDTNLELVGWTVITILIGHIFISFWALGLKFSQYALSLLYGLLIWSLVIFVISFLIALVASVPEDSIIHNIFGVIMLPLGLWVSLKLTLNGKLPFTKR